MQTTYITIETNDDASYDKAYNEYNAKNNFIDRMVIDLRRGCEREVNCKNTIYKNNE